MRRVFVTTSLIVFLTISTSVLATTLVHADTGTEGLGIGPLRNELQIAAGSTYSGKFNLTNNSQIAIPITLSAQVFSVVNQNYDYSFSTSAPAAKWVQFSQTALTLLPNSLQTITYQVAVPIGAEPGGSYISLFATTNTQSAQDGITPIERVASLLYITIPGDVSRLGSLLTLTSPVVSFGHSSWSATINNTGTAHFRSTDTLTMASIFGQTVASSQTSALILPSTVRLVSAAIPNPQWLGIYKATYVISLGDVTAQTVVRWIVYLPAEQLIPIICVVAATVLFVFRRRIFKKH